MRSVQLMVVALTLPTWATAQLEWYTDKDHFESAARARGLQLAGVELFEESELDPNRFHVMPDPLRSGVRNDPFPKGLEGIADLTIQSNTLGSNPVQPSPRGANGLVTYSIGYRGALSDIVLANTLEQIQKRACAGSAHARIGSRNTGRCCDGGVRDGPATACVGGL